MTGSVLCPFCRARFFVALCWDVVRCWSCRQVLQTRRLDVRGVAR